MRQYKLIVGLDISLDSFLAFLISSDENFTAGPKKFKRSEDGIAQLLLWIYKLGFNPNEVKVVMEATNNFWEIIAVKLDKVGIGAISIVNPKIIKDFSKSLRKKAKTDNIDAEVVALYGVRMKPENTDLKKSKKFGELRYLIRTREFWIKEKVRLENYVRNLKRSVFASKKETEWIEKEIKRIIEHIKEIEKEIEKLVEEVEELKKAVKLVDSIPGIGKVNGVVILVETGMFEGFKKGKEVVSYAGIVPRVYESGIRKGDRGITREGNKRLRNAAYFAAVASLRSSCEVFRKFYERLVSRGKAKKVALVALAGKILRIAFALVKKEEIFNDQKLRLTNSGA